MFHEIAVGDPGCTDAATDTHAEIESGKSLCETEGGTEMHAKPWLGMPNGA